MQLASSSPDAPVDGAAPVAAPSLPPRRDIQGLRALAVALVVLDHAGVPLLRGGFVGVDVFFVVSGFLITSLLLREVDRTGRLSLPGFFARRARRILPMSTVVLVVVAVVSGLALSVARAKDVVVDELWAALFAANIHFAQVDTDYFSADRPPSPVQHYWSLAVEEQFYLVWPLLLLLLVILGRRLRMPVVVPVAVLAFVSLAWSVVSTSESPAAAYFSSAARAWELGAGALLALAPAAVSRLPRRPRELLSVGGLVAVLVASVTYDSRTPFPGWAALLPVLGTVALLAAGVAPGDDVGAGRLLVLRPLTWLGDRSYSLYLWHWPVLLLGAVLLGHAASAPETVLLLTVAVALTEASHRLVEEPFRRGRVRLSRGRSALWLWPIAVGAVVVATAWVGRHGEVVLDERVAAARSYYARLAASGSPLAKQPATIPESVRQAVALADAGAPLNLPLENLDRLDDELWSKDYPCYAKFKMSETRLCPIGDTDSPVTVVAYGDSHMGMWLPALDRLGQRDGFSVVPLVKWACPSYDVPVWEAFRRDPYDKCDNFRAWALETIRTLQPDAVVLANRGLPGNVAVGEDRLVDTWRSGMASTLAAVGRLTPEVRVLGDVLRVDADPGDCLTQPDASMASCTFHGSEKSRLANRVTAREAAGAGVPYAGVAGLSCTVRGRCPLAVGHTVVYQDDDHLTMTWASRLTGALGRRLHLPTSTGS